MARTSASQIAQWHREFQELGAQQVRSALIVAGWDTEKRRHARTWLEHDDAANWQAERPPESTRGTFFLNRRNAKWWGYTTAALLLTFGLFRLWRRM